MKVLVTGAGGLIGRYLLERLETSGHEALGLDLKSDGKIMAADIMNRDEITAGMAKCRPEAVIHLAAQSSPPQSWIHPAETFQMNVNGTLHVLEAVRETCPEAKVIVACSSAEYAMSHDGKPIGEDYPLSPSNPYGISKMAAGELARVYGLRHGLHVIRVRPFFLVGPRKTGDVCSDFARGIAAIEKGLQKELLTGTLDVVRDIMDVRDGIAAFQAVMEKGSSGEAYNICTGHGVRIGDILDIYRELAAVPIVQRMDPSKVRPIDEPVRIGDPSKLKALGWAPSYSLRQTLQDILNYWRAREDV